MYGKYKFLKMNIIVSEPKARRQNLLVCMSRAMFVYALSYVLHFGQGQRYDVLIANNDVMPKFTSDYLASNGLTFVTTHEASSKKYSRLLIQPYQNFAGHREYLRQFSFDHISYYGDGLRNGMYSLPSLDKRTDELVYFGYELHEKAFYENLDQSQVEIPKKVVDFDYIKNAWNVLRSLAGITSNFPVLSSGDLLIAMRHWGFDHDIYAFKGSQNLIEYLSLESKDWEIPSRIIIKSHPWTGAGNGQVEALKTLYESRWGVDVIVWEEMFNPLDNFPELTSPEAVLWSNNQNLGYFFGFDSSLNNLMAYVSPETTIYYPKESIFQHYFARKASSSLVVEQINHQKAFSKAIFAEKKSGHIVIETSGSSFERMFSKISILEHDALTQERDALTQERDALTQERDALTQDRDALTQERDALTQERDALTQERDALTQERDALTQERDALTQSTIWRLSKPIRLFVSKIKYLFD